MTHLDSILKSRDITLLTKVCLVKALVFLVVMYGCEIWTIKKAEHWRIDPFYCGVEEDSWESLDHKEIKPVSPKGNQPWIFTEIQDRYWGWSSSTLFGHLMWCSDSLEKTLMLGKIEGRRRRGQQRTQCLDGITVNGHEFEQALGDGEGQGSLACCSPWGWKESDMTEWLKNNNCSWGSQVKHAQVAGHSFLQWTTFCQNSPQWPVHIVWPYTAWLMVSLS